MRPDGSGCTLTLRGIPIGEWSEETTLDKVDLTECFCPEVAHLVPQTRKGKETTVKDKSYLTP
jgi:hypothetical protein